LPQGDVLLHAGDISYRGRKDEIKDFLNWFNNLNFKYKIFIAGNHDFFFEKASKRELEHIIPPGIIYLQDSEVAIDGIKIWGSPVTPWFFNWAFNKPRGEPLRKHWALIPGNVDILLTHGPIYGVLDTVINDQHVGCKDLLKKVQEIKPRFHVFGHIHEGYGTVKIGATRFFNACVLNENYELVNKPQVFEI
jgi:Icc-related predicted phosphoesterase